MKNWILLVGFILLTKSAFALVEYDDEYVQDEVQSSASSPRRISKARAQKPDKGSSGKFFKAIQLGANYDSVGMDLNSQTSSEATTDEIQKYNIGLTILTSYDIYLDVSYWQAKSQNTTSNTELNKEGNPKYRLGFNWFQSGGKNPIQADLYIGYVQGKKNSIFASSRNDKIVGVETSKKFSHVVFGVGAEYRSTGRAQDEDEYSIGDITRLSAGLGWLVSNDIKFTFEGSAYKIKKNEDIGTVNKIEEDITFSVFTPELHLQLFRNVEMTLGAHVRTNKPNFKDDTAINQFVGARLLDLPGAYGNSVFTGLNFTFL